MYKKGDVIKFHDVGDLEYPKKGRLYTVFKWYRSSTSVELMEFPFRTYSTDRITLITLIEDV